MTTSQLLTHQILAQLVKIERDTQALGCPIHASRSHARLIGALLSRDPHFSFADDAPW